MLREVGMVNARCENVDMSVGSRLGSRELIEGTEESCEVLRWFMTLTRWESMPLECIGEMR